MKNNCEDGGQGCYGNDPALTMNNPAMTDAASEGLQREDVLPDDNRSTKTSEEVDDDFEDLTMFTTSATTRAANRRQQRITYSKYDRGWRRIVRNFSPSWFSVSMGTGIVSNLFFIIPYHARWLDYFCYIFFALNALVFFTALLVFILRFAIWPEIWPVMIAEVNSSLFLGCIPIAFATLVQVWNEVCVPAWGPWALYINWIGWMIDAIVAASITVFLCFTHICHGEHTSLRQITATQLLPIAASIVAAGAGSRVAESLIAQNPDHALGTVITCYVLWGMGTPLAMAVLVMYYQRLALHKLPPREVLVSCFLPLGPLGMSGYSMMYLGKVCRQLFPITRSISPLAGDFLYIQGFLVALILWGFGLVWLVFALATIWKCRPFPFNMGWWGFTFPLGVFASSTIQIGTEMPSGVFKVLGTIFSVFVIALWCVVAAGTARGAWEGHLFYAPCLNRLASEYLEKGKVVVTEKNV